MLMRKKRVFYIVLFIIGSYVAIYASMVLFQDDSRLPTKYLLIGVEGPSLSGKTYLINRLINKLKNDYDIHVVEEYVNFANGHTNFPPMLSKSFADSSNCANFFINLEQKRIHYLQNLLKKVDKEKLSIIFVDRLIFSIIYYRKLVNDIPCINIINESINRGQYIHPDFTLLLQLPKDNAEVIKRRKTRKEFPGSEFIFGSLGSNNYIEYFKDINVLKTNIIILQDTSTDQAITNLCNQIAKLFFQKNSRNLHQSIFINSWIIKKWFIPLISTAVHGNDKAAA